VTPLSLQVGVAGGLSEPVIGRNTPVPIEQTRTFTTARDGQESVTIRVYQGESREAAENELLGQFEFSNFQRGARGEVEIDVTFEINTDGIVNVTASDKRTGQQASTRITLSSGLSEREIKNIIDRGVASRVQTAPLAAPSAGPAPIAKPARPAAKPAALRTGSCTAARREAGAGRSAPCPAEDEDDDALIPVPELEVGDGSTDLESDLLADPEAAADDLLEVDPESVTQPDLDATPQPELSDDDLAGLDTSDLDAVMEPFVEADSLFDKSGADLTETDPESQS
jgi:hypothetical protein